MLPFLIAVTSTLVSIIIQPTLALNLTQGAYQFVNRVLDPKGNLLAITDFGQNENIVVTPLVFGQLSQMWSVSSFGSLQGVFTIIAPSSMEGNTLQAGVPFGVPGPLRTITNQNVTSILWQDVQLDDGSFTLADVEMKTFWGLSSAAINMPVQALNQSTNSSLQFWVAIRVS